MYNRIPPADRDLVLWTQSEAIDLDYRELQLIHRYVEQAGHQNAWEMFANHDASDGPIQFDAGYARSIARILATDMEGIVRHERALWTAADAAMEESFAGYELDTEHLPVSHRAFLAAAGQWLSRATATGDSIWVSKPRPGVTVISDVARHHYVVSMHAALEARAA